jgi:hypothetical protein
MMVALSLLLAASSPSLPAGYRVATEIVLVQSTDGLDATVQLLRDANIATGSIDSLWGGADSGGAGTDSLLRVIDAHGLVLETLDLEAPLAHLARAPEQLPGVLQLDVDFTAGMGSYNGPGTCFLHATGSWLQRMEVEEEDGRMEALMMARTLKQDWKWWGKADLLSVSSHPNWKKSHLDGTGEGFVTEFVRYHWDGKRWHRFARQRAGMWEADGEFPARNRFP